MMKISTPKLVIPMVTMYTQS